MICQANRIDKICHAPDEAAQACPAIALHHMAREVRLCVAVRRYDVLGNGDSDAFDRIHDFCCR